MSGGIDQRLVDEGTDLPRKRLGEMVIEGVQARYHGQAIALRPGRPAPRAEQSSRGPLWRRRPVRLPFFRSCASRVAASPVAIGPSISKDIEPIPVDRLTLPIKPLKFPTKLGKEANDENSKKAIRRAQYSFSFR